MPSRPSSLPFASFLVYPSPGSSANLANYKRAVISIKEDRFSTELNTPWVDYAVDSLAKHRAGEPPLDTYFAGGAVLVPLPRSGLLQKNAHWPAKRISEALVAHGIGNRVETMLVRETAIRKSAGSASRPSPQEHYNSLAPAIPIQSDSIILVDDVITRGSTALGAAWRVLEAMPAATVKVFAMARTLADSKVGEFTDIVAGTIEQQGENFLVREP